MNWREEELPVSRRLDGASRVLLEHGRGVRGPDFVRVYSSCTAIHNGLTMRCSEPGPRALVTIVASRGPGR